MRDKLLQTGINTFKWVARHHILLPRIVCVETTKVCNLKCPGCRRYYKRGSISSESGPKHLTVEALWRVIATTPIQLVRWEGDGEPMCNPYFKGLLKFCKRLGIKSAMATNATLIDKEWVRFLEENGIVRLHVSFDGAKKETFERARVGADYGKVLYNCKLVGKSKIQLFMSVVLSSDEVVEQLPEYVELAKSVGATGIHLMKFQQENLEFGNPPDLGKYSGLLKKFGEIVRDKDLIYVGTVTDQPTFIGCSYPYTTPYVLLNRDVYACTYMANLRRSEVYLGEVVPVPYKNYCMGNLEDNWMKDIWKNDAYKELRETLKETRPTQKVISRETLLEVKKGMVDKERFSYCQACLCRWGESGL